MLRTNCIDCLDRTNVGQFSYARVAVVEMLRALGVACSPRVVARAQAIVLELFGEHGDVIAVQYAGSGAMHKASAGTEEASEGGPGGGGGGGGDAAAPKLAGGACGGARACRGVLQLLVAPPPSPRTHPTPPAPRAQAPRTRSYLSGGM